MLSFREQLRLAGQNAALARSLSPVSSAAFRLLLRVHANRARDVACCFFFPVLYCDKVVHL